MKVAREKYADFREVPQDMQVCALERTDKAFDGFYSRCEEGAAKKGYPRHRKRIRSMSWKLRKHKLKTGERVRAAAALRGERWVTTLNETRNKNEAQDMGNLETAEQLLLFNDLLTGFPSL